MYCPMMDGIVVHMHHNINMNSRAPLTVLEIPI